MDSPPVAKVVPVSTTLFGDTRTDPYGWLRDRNDPDTLKYLEAENAYTKAMMKSTEELQSKLYTEMLGRIKQTDLSVPVKREEYFYYTRTEEGMQYAIYCRKKGSLESPEEILLDGNVLGQGQKYFRIGNFAVSPNHRLLAYSVDFEGDEMYTIRVMDLERAPYWPTRSPTPTTRSNGPMTTGRSSTPCWTRPSARTRCIATRWALRMSSLIYQENDERYTLALEKTSSRAFILINIGSSLTSEVRYVSTDRPYEPFQTVLPRVQDVEYDLTHHDDSFYIRTNDHARTFRVVRAPVGDASRPNWEDFLPKRDRVTVEDVHAFRDYLVIEERDRGLSQIRIQHFPTGEAYTIEFPEPVYTAGLGPNAEFDTHALRFHYASLVTAPCVFDYDMETRQRELKKQQEVLGGYDPAQYQSERVYAKASDNTEIPISIVYKKGFRRDGFAPMLLYGYGAYGISMDPAFSSDRLSLLDRGMVYAIAHIRGGADLGKPWHEDGRLLVKMNTFTDFIAAAEYLIAEKYTSPARLAIQGGSAGGLLMGAVANLRPALFAVIVANVPFVDALNTELDATLPLTVGEWEEWGNPAEKQYYDYIKSYSPYDNVEAKAYPKILVTAGLNDPRVSYWEPAKWVAKLRALKKDDRLLLLKTEMGSGHFGASGRYERWKEIAFNYAFILRALNLEMAP